MAKRRTREENTKFIAEIRVKLTEYIANTEIPIVAEFAYQNNIGRTWLYETPALSDAIKTLIDKKEAQLERKALLKEIHPTMAIFSLKQLGWKDVNETNLNVSPSEVARQFAEMVSASGTGKAT